MGGGAEGWKGFGMIPWLVGGVEGKGGLNCGVFGMPVLVQRPETLDEWRMLNGIITSRGWVVGGGRICMSGNVVVSIVCVVFV